MLVALRTYSILNAIKHHKKNKNLVPFNMGSWPSRTCGPHVYMHHMRLAAVGLAPHVLISSDIPSQMSTLMEGYRERCSQRR